MTRKPVREYHYRGMIEHGPRYRLCEGYSEQGQHGPLQPYQPRKLCLVEAKRDGVRAVFVRGAK